MGCEQSVPVDNTNYTNNNQNSSTYSPPNVNNQSYAYYPAPNTYPNQQATNYYPNQQAITYYPNQPNFSRQTHEDPVNYNPKPSAPPAYSNQIPYNPQIPYNSQLAYQQHIMLQQKVVPQYYVYQGTGQGINQVYYIPSNNAKVI